MFTRGLNASLIHRVRLSSAGSASRKLGEYGDLCMCACRAAHLQLYVWALHQAPRPSKGKHAAAILLAQAPLPPTTTRCRGCEGLLEGGRHACTIRLDQETSALCIANNSKEHQESCTSAWHVPMTYVYACVYGPMCV